MSYYDTIYEFAADNYGLITSTQAKALNIPGVELVKLSHRGRLTRIWQGVYRISHYVPTPLDKYAEAVAIVGDGAFIYGESVLAMYGLAFINPIVLYTATSKRVRKNLPEYIRVIKSKNIAQTIYHEGIHSQDIISAIIVCKNRIMTNRLLNAIEESLVQGLITPKDKIYLKEALSV